MRCFSYFLFLVLVIIPAIPAQPISETSSIVELGSNWEYRWGDSPKDDSGLPLWTYEDLENEEWKPMELPGWAPDRNGRNYIWQRIDLPEGDWLDPSIFTLGPFMYFEVYLDKEFLYRFGDPGTPTEFQLTGTPWHLIHVPGDFQRKTLFFRIYSNYYLIGINDRVYLGSHADIIKRMIVRDMDRIITGTLCIFLGFFALFLFIRSRNLKEFFSFGFFSLWIGVYIIRYSHVKQFFTGGSAVWTYLWLFSLFLIPIGIISFVENVIGAGIKAYVRRLWQFHLVLTFILLPLIIFLPNRFAVFGFTAIRILYVVYILALLITLIIHALRKNRDAMLFLLGLCILGFFGFYDTGIGFGLIERTRPLGHLGMFGFTIIVLIILCRRLIEMYRNLQNYSIRIESMSREKEKMIRELHDGIGGIMTNINLLVDIAQQPEEKIQHTKTLSTISSLSREGLFEIRSFMQSLDEKEATWETLAAELRFHGKNTLDPRGISSTIRTTIEEAVTAPGNMLFLHIYRMYREALTNIIKHSEAKKVTIELHVSSEKIELKVGDDGIGFQAGNNRGRGITNMKRRAEELGGTFSIESGKEGMAVHFILPTPRIPITGYSDNMKQ